MSNSDNWYREDLAYIHDVGFSDFALQSAREIIQILKNNHLKRGLIVDLGCGSGLSAQEFIQANYQVLGIDISEAAIAIARNKVPQAEFKVDSLLKAEIPPCSAVISIGECLNYLFDRDNNLQSLINLFERIYQSLIPQGLLIFDLLEPFITRKSQGFKTGKDWIVMYEKEEDKEQNKLTRRITTLRKIGDYYRRDDEVHRVRLYESSEIADKLRQVGFQVQTRNNYGQFQLPKGHHVFIAQK